MEAQHDPLVLARLASATGDGAACARAAGAVVGWALGSLDAYDERAGLARRTLEAWLAGEAGAESLYEAARLLGSPRGDRGDRATEEALRLIFSCLSLVADGASGHASPCGTLVEICEDVIWAAGLRDWDEGLSDAALCEAAPWPDPAYERMVEQREAAFDEARRALSSVLASVVSPNPYGVPTAVDHKTCVPGSGPDGV